MKMTCHKTESIYRRYAIVDEAMLRESTEKLAAYHSAKRRLPAAGVPIKPFDSGR